MAGIREWIKPSVSNEAATELTATRRHNSVPRSQNLPKPHLQLVQLNPLVRGVEGRADNRERHRDELWGGGGGGGVGA